jgi:hypothetical protein
MKNLSIILCLILVAGFAGKAQAERNPPKPVSPLVHEGVKYVAPLDNPREGRIEARDEKTGKKLWDVVVFTVEIKPNMEEDVQWVFVTTLAVRDNKLLVTDEKNRQYTVDLKTKKVEGVRGEKAKIDAKKTPPTKSLGHASQQLLIDGWTPQQVEERYGKPQEVKRSQFMSPKYGVPKSLPEMDEQWYFPYDMGHKLVCFKEGKVVLAIEEWSDF